MYWYPLGLTVWAQDESVFVPVPTLVAQDEPVPLQRKRTTKPTIRQLAHGYTAKYAPPPGKVNLQILAESHAYTPQVVIHNDDFHNNAGLQQQSYY